MPRPEWIPIIMRAENWPDDWMVSLAMDLWAQSEGMPNSWHNPWAATYLSGLGNHRCIEPRSLPDGSRNTDHVSQCPDWNSCALAYAEFWQQSWFNNIDSEMHEPLWKGKLEKIFYAINGSPACSGCQGGHYPIRLYDYLAGHIRNQPSNVLVPGQPIAPPKQPITIFKAFHDLTRQMHITIPRELRRIEKDRRAMLSVVRAAKSGRFQKRGK